MSLDTKIRELIAVGASVTASCQSCVLYHVGQALRAGASKEELSEALQVGRAVRKGAAAKLDHFVAGMTPIQTSATEPEPEDGCGCP